MSIFNKVFASHLGEIFKVMFPVSNVVQKIAIGSTKLSYLIRYGLAPYFHQELLKSLQSKFIICVDETFKEVPKKGNYIDIIMRHFINVTIKSHNIICHHHLWEIPQLSTSWKTSWKLQVK